MKSSFRCFGIIVEQLLGNFSVKDKNGDMENMTHR